MNFNFANISTLKTLNLKKGIWVILGGVSLILRALADYSPHFVERFYSRGIFQFIRFLFDNSLGILPIPWIFFFYIAAFIALISSFKPIFNKTLIWKQRLGKTAFSLLSLTGFLLFWFFTLWGYNYARPSFTQQMAIKIENPDSLGIENELKIATQEAIAAREILVETPLSIDDHFEDKTRQSVYNLLTLNGFPASKNLRGRSLQPNGILFGFGIAGIYMPFVGESNIDNGLHDLEKPFSMAHEMAHGYGWTDEATANFIAYLACTQSDDALTRYSGYLMYFRYVASNYRRLNPEAYKQFRETLPATLKADLKAINLRQEQFKTWFDTDSLNNLYLNWQGVQGGIVSYSRVVVLVYSWRQKNIRNL